VSLLKKKGPRGIPCLSATWRFSEKNTLLGKPSSDSEYISILISDSQSPEGEK
jgi:hypothetical protein